ncbi:hypothetical protein [Beijerinckia indica]|uniref:hypothetical protein n=1 Tax=Beijerinckia indica TaxID=533 RepID=UPI0011D0CF7B|nr:hypothetical protein [Beijerinckia indica]
MKIFKEFTGRDADKFEEEHAMIGNHQRTLILGLTLLLALSTGAFAKMSRVKAVKRHYPPYVAEVVAPPFQEPGFPTFQRRMRESGSYGAMLEGRNPAAGSLP